MIESQPIHIQFEAGGEELVVAYENTYGLPSFITHTMNVFGERQIENTSMVIKKVRDDELVNHADKTKNKAGSRHYIHAEDVANALMFCLINALKPIIQRKCQKFNIVKEMK